MGLEAGSKPELLIVLAGWTTPKPSLCATATKIEYIETTLVAQRLGRKPFLVVEKPSEVASSSRQEARYSTAHRRAGPACFFRHRKMAKLIRSGKVWRMSPDISLVDDLEATGMIECLQLLHFHIGSQISAIRAFESAVQEATRVCWWCV